MKTLTVDNDNRIRLPDVKPRQVFTHEMEPGGRIILTPIAPIESKPNKVRFVKKDGFTVGVTEQPVSEQAIKEALADFP